MVSNNSKDNEFIERLTSLAEAKLTNPQFGVSMLAKEMGMSRSNLHRKVNSELKISVSQFINQVRLKKAKDILRHTSDTVSEVAYKVGYNNVSYFIKCFHEYYGYSPGEVGNREENENEIASLKSNKRWIGYGFIPILAIVILLIVLFTNYKPFSYKKKSPEQTVAVMLPIYHTSDSSNYIIDGIATEVYNKLVLVQDLTVRPWTSIRRYRNVEKGIPEIADELKVNYIVEIICQHHNENNFSITASLVNVALNKPISIGSYKGTFEDIFTIEQELSDKIVKEINAKITSAERIRMQKIPTENKTALRHYRHGLEKQNTDAKIAIEHFNQAIENDDQFALAYAELANSYNMLDTGVNDGIFTKEISQLTIKAILYDNEHDKCLIPMANLLIEQKNWELAIHFLEKAVEYNPNSAGAYRLLNWSNAQWGVANSPKRVEHALQTVKYNVLEENHKLKSSDYEQLSRALRSAGFYNEAMKYIGIAIGLNPESKRNIIQKSEILYCRDRSLDKAIELLLQEWNYETTDYYINLALFKNYYRARNYVKSLEYFKIIEPNFINHPKQVLRLADTYKRLGFQKASNEILKNFNISLFKNSTRYFDIDTNIRYYSLKNDTLNAIAEMQKLLQKEYHFDEFIVGFESESIYDNIRHITDFQEILNEIRNKFWQDHEQIRKLMEDKGLIDMNL